MNNSKLQTMHTMIGPDAIINGPMKLEQGLIVYGKIYGDIATDGQVRVAKNGLVDGNIIGSNIHIGGTVTGNVKSRNQVILKKSCILKGDISYRKLHIEDGAQFEGKCDLLSD